MMLAFYAPRSGVVVDVTANARRMWHGLDSSRVVFLDVDPGVRPSAVADFAALPLRSGCADVLVFDPPHLPAAAASAASSDRMVGFYGLARSPRGENVAALLPAFLSEARRVLRPGGVVFAKVKDYVHNHRYQWMLCELVLAARAAGLTPCDLIIKRDPSGGALKSSKWKNAYHARNVHCWWAVLRNGGCEP